MDFEYIKCNLCGNNDYTILYDNMGIPCINGFKASGNEISKDRIVKCNICGLIYVNPRLKEDIILLSYSNGKDEKFVSQNKWREMTFKKSMKLINKYAKKGRLLDIGTAGGAFLHVAKKDGWNVYGIEPNKWLCDWGLKHYGIKINPGTLFDYKYPDNYFDLITLWDVLEHVGNPIKMLKECHRILKKDGILLINYPDIGSGIAKIMGKKWVFLLSVHLFYFTKDSIRQMLEKSGYEIIKIKPHIQTLSLGYLAERMEPYNKSISKFLIKFVKGIRIDNFEIPYWLGQSLVLARKVDK